ENTDDSVRITRTGFYNATSDCASGSTCTGNVCQLDFYIDRYEASRPDASNKSSGLDESHVCTNKSVLPWANASYSEADTACKNSSRNGKAKRLCTAAQMLAACQGAALSTYTYG